MSVMSFVLVSDTLTEYCTLETFQPTCMNNEVVVIEKALYGRRRVGKCIKDSEAALSSDQRFIGCSADVLGILNAKCSGTKRCEVRIPDAKLEKTEPCLPGLKMYLEVSYTCAEGKLLIFIECSMGGWLTSCFDCIRYLKAIRKT